MAQQKPSPSHDFLLEHRREIALRANELIWNAVPELQQRFGDAGRAKSFDDLLYHLDFLATAIAYHSLQMIDDYAGWLKVLFSRTRLKPEDLFVTFRLLGQAIRETAPESVAAVTAPFLERLQSTYLTAPAVLTSFLDGLSGATGALASTYMDLLLAGRRSEAADLILRQAESGITVRDIYLRVFQPVQREIGLLWQTGKISVGQEHYCTAATQLVMSRLYPYMFGGPRNGLRFVGACIGNELHEFGIRMVTDFFEMAGWDTYYIGANTPATAILSIMRDQKIDLLGLSTTISPHVHDIKELIGMIRSDPSLSTTRILVGGHPFAVDPDLVRSVGADGSAADADEALQMADRLMQTGERA